MLEGLILSPGLWAVVIILVVWEGVWKFMGMWRAARNKSIPWFIAIGILNTLGILPISYLYVFSKKK